MASVQKSSILKPMQPRTNRLTCGLAGFLTAVTVSTVLADTRPNPYDGIVARNAFALKPLPPPVDTTPPPPAIPLCKVVLTGITSIFGPTRALLEITEQEAGKTATTRRPILREGERDGAIEVLAIDLEKSLVKIRNAG